MFEKNVGGLDRKARFVGGVLLVVAALGGLGTVGTGVSAVVLAAGAGLLFNAVTQRCLANRLLGIDTCGERC
ncbi:MAG: DUF2892 domain-containing protein [Salinirussus sp.]